MQFYWTQNTFKPQASGPVLWSVLCLVEVSAANFLKFLVIYEKEAPHLYFVLSPANYIAGADLD